eukprot:CAMPEP_0117537874 /NCGR_PEP_ID=MMETSP0784-20121206/42192_1 /TAXON_ID=39447 /ORGANISM="" /LENGTH=43 /DNA_ID= /DNA_START= /DNA_END= /DNA_ORIENTATION=
MCPRECLDRTQHNREAATPNMRSYSSPPPSLQAQDSPRERRKC